MHKKHTHKYIRTQPEGAYKRVWACADPECNHIMPLHLEYYLLAARGSVCWQCGMKFILDEEALKEDMPRCVECRLRDMINIDDIPWRK
jgi:hypothetical protein